jgi:hypothetical protein
VSQEEVRPTDPGAGVAGIAGSYPIGGSELLEQSTINRARFASSAAQAFYCDVLQGQQVWNADRAGRLEFIVEGTHIDVAAGSATDRGPVVLCVPNPNAVAERCWDAGYSVEVGDESNGNLVSVIDPFGRRIDLVR